jgi:hypothetical protein
MKFEIHIDDIPELETYEGWVWQGVTIDVAGIYILYLGSKVVYVGRTMNMYNRIMQHCLTEHNGNDYFDAISIIHIDDIRIQCLVEILLIDYLEPRLNKSYGGEPLSGASELQPRKR